MNIKSYNESVKGVVDMKINEVIIKYRNEKNLTQEQVAHYLGVSAPAVKKKEVHIQTLLYFLL